MNRRVAELVISLAFMASGAQAATAGEPALVAIVEGTVTLAGGTAVIAGERVAVPSRVDATGGSVSLLWEGSGTRLLAESVSVRLHSADSGGVRIGVGDARIDLPAGQALHARRGTKVPKVFLRTPPENTAALTVGSCQTVVRLLPGSAASIELDREGMQVVLQSEAGTVEVLGRGAALRQVLAGQRFLDGCVPPPDGSVEIPESLPPLTPFLP